MSTTARKARKREGIQFQHPVKVATPPHARFVPTVLKKLTDDGVLGHFPSNRAMAKIVRRYGEPAPTGSTDLIAAEYKPEPTVSA